MRICIAGYFGTRNTGDELLLDAAVAGLRKRFGAAIEFSTLAAYPELVQQVHPDILLHGAARGTGWQRTGHVTENKPPAADQAALDLLDQADMLVIAGGGLWGNGTVYCMSEVQYMAERGKPVYAISMGVDPFKFELGEQYRQNYFRHLKACVTRDRWGARCLEYIGVDNVCRVLPANDTVFTLFEDVHFGGERKKEAHVCICNIRNWKNHIPKSMTMESTAQAIHAGLQRACDRHGIEAVLYPFAPDQQGGYDVTRSIQFSECVGGMHVADNKGATAREIYHDLTDAKLVISERYHACVMAGLAGVPFIALCMDHKNREIARGFGMPYIDMSEHMIEARMYAAVREMMDDHHVWSERTRALAREHRLRAQWNFDVMAAN